MQVLVTGRQGQLARSLVQRANGQAGLAVTALGRPELDLTRPELVAAALATVRPDVIVNAAAYTSVDKAESEPAEAFAVNRDGAAHVAAAAARQGVRLIHISTDYVYAGDKPAPYVETDPTNPLCVYSELKLQGEQRVREACPEAVILRTSWVYSPFANNFVKTMLRLAETRPVLRVVDDQYGNPTSALALADAILQLCQRFDGCGGVYHAAGRGSVTWCGLAREIFALAPYHGLPTAHVEAIRTADYPTAARRPVNSRLDTSALRQRYGIALPAWQTSLAEALAVLSGRS